MTAVESRSADASGAGGPQSGASGASGDGAWCDRCGGAVAGADHATCRAARELEPPRFCPSCRRRMKVQILPAGWSAVCVEHGETHS